MSKPFFEKPILEIDDIEQPAVAYAQRRGWIIEKVVSQSRKGWPDRTCIRKGRVMFVEFKRPGGQLSAIQVKRIKELRAAGAEVHVIDNLEAAYELFR